MSRTATLALLALSVAGCVSLKRTPEPRLFVLRALASPAAEPAVPPPAPSGGEPVLALLGVRIPDHLERPQLVVWAEPNELRIDEFLRWAEPLDAGVTRTLADDLQALLPSYRVVRAPWPAATSPRCRLATDLRVFGTQPDGRVTVEGSFTLLARAEERSLARRPFAFARPAQAGPWEPGRAVEAMSELLVDVARDMAASVEALPPETEPS
ncbi:MAG TPA: PqiC family protein [Vicinamibacteria bacterium]|nr:PqiC family protein [Vicinamibacteria bacterium]